MYGCIEKILVDAAHHLGELALETGDHERASWAAARGLVVVPCQESLYRVQIRAAAAAGDSQGIIDAYRRATCAAETITPWTEVQPETVLLFDQLTGRSPLARGAASSAQASG